MAESPYAPELSSDDLRNAMALINMAAERDLFNTSRRMLTFDGKRDVARVAGYLQNPTFEDYFNRYSRGGIASRMIDLPVNATWGGGSIEIPNWPEWEKFERKLRATARFAELDRIAGIGNFAVLLIGVTEESSIKDNQNAYEKPVQELGSLDDVLFLRQIPQNKITIRSTVDNSNDPRFGMPEMYEIELDFGTQVVSDVRQSIAFSPQTKKVKVHWSRIVHVISKPSTSEVLGIPRLQSVINRIDDLEKVLASSGEAYWQTVDGGVHFDFRTGSAAGATEQEDLRRQTEEWAHGLQKVLRTSNMDVKRLSAAPVDPSSVADVLFTVIAAASEIPKRVMFGSERGELASTQDRKNFSDMIENRRTSYTTPHILSPFIERLSTWGIAPEFEELDIRYPAVEILNAKELADIRELNTKSAVAATQVAVMGGPITDEELRDMLGLDNDTVLPARAKSGKIDDDIDESDPDVRRQFDRGRMAA